MTARAGQWSLISDDGKDPVPGDPDAVRGQATYYADMAQTILDEANRLATLGQDDELVGKYKESLQEELGDLSDEVRKAHGRYDAVGTALKPFATALDTARSESWGALQDAVSAHNAQASANAMPNPQATDGKPLTDAQKADQRSRTTAINNANDALNRAKTRLSHALSDLNSAGKKAAGIIKDHSDDDLKDHHHWWDVVVKIVKVIIEIANYVVIALAIISLFIPGLDLIIFAITAAILLADTILAATGNGSWMDVIVDAVALLTLGLGSSLAKGGERAAEAAVEDATKAAIKTEFRSTGNIITRNLFNRGAKMAWAEGEGSRLVQAFVKDGVEITAWDAAKAGGRDLAENSKLIDSLAAEFGGGKWTRSVYLDVLKGSSATVFYTGAGITAGNVAFSKSNFPGIEGLKPYSNTWEETKEKLAYQTPLSASEYNWADHPDVANAVSTTVFGPVLGPELASLGG